VSSQINFLREHRKLTDAVTQKDRLIARYTMFGLGGFLVLVIGLTIVRFVVSSQRSEVTESTEETKGRITRFSSIERQYTLFVKKVQLLHGLDQQRQAKREAMQFFYDLIPEDSVIQQVKLDAKTSTISFQVQSFDVFRMLNLLRILRENIQPDSEYSIKTDALSRKADASYTLSGTLSYGSARFLSQSDSS
jgi:Tfp pilus assembly protein PilN